MIRWLELTKITKTTKHLSNHYILTIENKFMVFSSKPIDGLSIKISSTNIAGTLKDQYIIMKVHNIDPLSMITTASIKGDQYFVKYFTKLQPLIEKLMIS